MQNKIIVLMSRVAALALCCTLSVSLFTVPSAQAQTTAGEREQAVSQSGSTIRQVFEQPEFGKERKQTVWRLKEKKNEDKKTDDERSSSSEIMRWIAENMSAIIRIIAWIGLAVIVYLLVRLVIRNFGDWASSNTVYIPPAEIAGLDIRPESLPKDIAGEAQKLADTGQLRAALSLLFRGSLSILAHRDKVPFVRGDTEQECLERVRSHARSMADYFLALTGAWQRLAYAHLEVNSAEVKQLCLTWPTYFSESASTTVRHEEE